MPYKEYTGSYEEDTIAAMFWHKSRAVPVPRTCGEIQRKTGLPLHTIQGALKSMENDGLLRSVFDHIARANVYDPTPYGANLAKELSCG